MKCRVTTKEYSRVAEVENETYYLAEWIPFCQHRLEPNDLKPSKMVCSISCQFPVMRDNQQYVAPNTMLQTTSLCFACFWGESRAQLQPWACNVRVGILQQINLNGWNKKDEDKVDWSFFVLIALATLRPWLFTHSCDFSLWLLLE